MRPKGLRSHRLISVRVKSGSNQIEEGVLQDLDFSFQFDLFRHERVLEFPKLFDAKGILRKRVVDPVHVDLEVCEFSLEEVYNRASITALNPVCLRHSISDPK